MPCTKCKDGKYKWGNTGECKYATKEECDKANPKKYSKMNPTPLGKKTYEEYAKELKEFNLSKVEKVELALNEDIKKNVDEITFNSEGVNDILKILKKETPTLRKLIDNGKNRSSENMKLVSKTEQLVNKYVKAAKELGISGGMIDVVSKSFEKAKNQAEDIKKEIQSISDI
jgi:hypothetical protein